MPTTVELGFNLAANGIGNYLTLSDPVKGKLNDAAYPLAGDVLVDVTSTVRDVTVRRGRSRTLEKFTAGLAQVVLDNRGRDFDPTYVAQQATRTNLITNPSFEVDVNGWGNWVCVLARITTDSRFGGACLQVSHNSASFGGGPYLGPYPKADALVTVGLSYTFSGYVKDVSTGMSHYAGIEWVNSSDGTISSSLGATVAVSTSSWTRISVTGTAPVGAVRARPFLYVNAPANGKVSLMDGFLFEQSSTLQAYFDGSVSDNSIRFSSRGWTGTANASTSTITYWVPGTGSPYSGSIVPRKQVSISRDGKAIYTGNVEGWSWDYDLSGDATAEVRAVDGFASLAQADMTAGTAPGSTPGARIGTALTYAGWPTAARALSTGNAVLDADVIADGVNVLQYIQKVEASEPGAFFMSKDGLATFLSRAQLQDPTSGNVTFGSGGVPIVEYQAASLTDEMKNSVSVTWTNGSAVGGTVTASDATSISAYGQFDYSLDTLLSGGLQAQRLADWLVSSYKDPKYRIDSITVLLDSLTTMQQGQVLDLELGDVVTVAMSLPNVNAVGSAVSQLLSIDAIEHRIGVDRHFVTFTMSETTTGFVLNSADFGVLNVNSLGF